MTPIEIYEKLVSECRPGSIPIPHKLFEGNCKPKTFGMMSYLISESYELMIKTNGKSNWEVDCSCLNDKNMGKMYMTKNALTKELIICLTRKFILDLKEEEGKIFATINASYLFEWNKE